MIRYIVLEDTVLVIDDSILDPNGEPLITEITIQEYESLGGAP
jgi:hypothetical protein